ncbi:hypothetical protein WISP_90568 [Willisornis vidua]|uniref:Uncharacterized protein n=1 Tax=Willisornis vidua TaxID=1566151 RepID=A0ABQ9D6G0_9PASS|nr:hypothetical protein WISP_90568 [Willisornis vidua]
MALASTRPGHATPRHATAGWFGKLADSLYNQACGTEASELSRLTSDFHSPDLQGPFHYCYINAMSKPNLSTIYCAFPLFGCKIGLWNPHPKTPSCLGISKMEQMKNIKISKKLSQ